jgi:hypothetical protein
VATCTAYRKDGAPCTAQALPGRLLCWAHDPDLTEQRRTKSAEGGKNRATSRRLDKLTPATLRPLLTKFIAAVDAVEAGKLEPRQASAMAASGSVILKFYEVGYLEATLAETQARLEALERGQSA